VKLASALVCATATLSLGGCYVLANDEGERYLQRKDTVTLSAGDAKDVNARTHMLAAWPRGVGDRRIPAQASRMVEHAIKPYRSPPKETGPSPVINIGAGETQGMGKK
jgi:hypothetical protein